MPNSRPSILRRKYLIKRGLQFRYIGLVFILILLASAVTGYTVFATGWSLLGEKLANVYPQGRLIYVFNTANATLVRNLLLVSPFIFIMALLFSHKIAGPVYRIEKSLFDIAKGNLSLKIKLRKGDELKDMAEIINMMTEQLSGSIGENKKKISALNEKLRKIRETISVNPSDYDTISNAVSALQKDVKEIEESLNKWSTPS